MSESVYVASDHCLYLRAGGFDPTETNNLNSIFTGCSSPGAPKTLVIHFHGGLVNKAIGNTGAETMFRQCYAGANCYPVFFVWESGFLDALWRSLPQIFAESIFKRLLERVSGFALGKIKQAAGLGGPGVRGAVRPPLRAADPIDVKGEWKKAERGETAFADKDPAAVPPGEVVTKEESDAIIVELMKDEDLAAEAAKIAQGLRTREEVTAEAAAVPRGVSVRGSYHTLMSQEVIDEMRPSAESEAGVMGLLSGITVLKRLVVGAVKVVVQVVRRFASRRDHGIQATIIEEILREFYVGNLGQAVWNTMKEDTDRAFGADPAEFGGTGFLNSLNSLCRAPNPPTRIVLVGHSAGAVYICRFLEHADAQLPPGVKFDVVLMAPACDFALLATTLQHHGSRVAKFRMFTMQDVNERKDLLLDVEALNVAPALKKLYPGSLLYFISGVLERDADSPIVGMERFHTEKTFQGDGFPDIDSVRRYLARLTNGSVWSVAKGDAGLNCEAIHHAGFPEDPVMQKSLAHLLSEGF